MLLLGIDPALAATGYIGVKFNLKKRTISVVEKGVIKTSSSKVINTRLIDIYAAVDTLLKKLRPDAVILEKIYSHWRHPTTAALLGHVRGVIILCISQKGVPVVEYSTTHIKKAVTGRGNASNSQMKKMVGVFFAEKIRSEHIVYAAALVLAHIHVSMSRLSGITIKG